MVTDLLGGTIGSFASSNFWLHSFLISLEQYLTLIYFI